MITLHGNNTLLLFWGEKNFQELCLTFSFILVYKSFYLLLKKKSGGRNFTEKCQINFLKCIVE